MVMLFLGSFDLNLCEGNNEKYEYLAQIGFNGFEAGAEGPIGRSSALFLANYRYSTLELLNALGVDFGVVDIPKYQDLCFKAVMPVKNGKWSIFGLGGINSILSENAQRSVLDRYTLVKKTGVSGISSLFRPGRHSKIKTTAAASYSHNYAKSEVMNADTLQYKSRDDNHENILMMHTEWYRKLSARDNIILGIYFDKYLFDLMDSIYRPSLKIMLVLLMLQDK